MRRRGGGPEGSRRSERNKKKPSGSRTSPPLDLTNPRILDYEVEETVRPALLTDQSSGESAESPRTMSGRGNLRLKYRRFKGDGKEDVDDWLCEFNSTAAANEEDVATKLRIFQGLLKGEALQWYQDIPDPVRNNWEQLTATFLRTFREVGGEARTLGRLSKMKMRTDETVRRYGQRVRNLIHRLTPGITASVQIEWYVAGFPEEMGFHVRQARPLTLQDAMEAAQNYENSKQSLRQSRRRSKTEGSEHDRKVRKKKKKYSSSGSSDSSSGSSPDTRSSEYSSSEEETRPQRVSSSKIRRKGHTRGTGKVKEEVPDGQQMMRDIQSSLAAIKVHLTDPHKPRRTIPAIRNNVWCTRCGLAGHYPNECPHLPPRKVHFVEEEGTSYPALPEYDEDDPEGVPVYQTAPMYGSGRGQQLQGKPRYPSGRPSPSGYTPGDQLGVSAYPRRQVTMERQYGLCFSCGEPGHYAPDCPRRGGQGAPLELPCQNCGHYGHMAQHCRQPERPRVAFKQVDVPPREKTALNYGHKEGVENQNS